MGIQRAPGRGHRNWWDACEDRVTDQLGDLRDYGVSAGGKAVCPVGNPINHSVRTGLIHPSTRYGTQRGSHFRSKPILHPDGRVSPRCFRCIVSIENGAKPFDLFGVGHKPNPVAQMWSTDSGSRYAMPLRIIPDLGQVSENSTEPSTGVFAGASKKTSDVLHKEEVGSYFVSKADDLTPETGPRTFNSGPPASDGKVLAREASGNDINPDPISGKSPCGEGSNVVVARDAGPVPCEDFARVFFDFTEGDGLETACAFEAKGKSSDAAEKVKDAQLFHLPPPTATRLKRDPQRRDGAGGEGEQGQAVHSREHHAAAPV